MSVLPPCEWCFHVAWEMTVASHVELVWHDVCVWVWSKHRDRAAEVQDIKSLCREACVTVGVMYDPKSHLRAHVTRLMLHYRDSFPYMESGATVMYGPLLLPKLWLSSLTCAVTLTSVRVLTRHFRRALCHCNDSCRRSDLVICHLGYSYTVVI